VIAHRTVRLALRAHLATLAVCTTGSTTLAATATGYTRAAGSFLTDGFALGMQVTPTGFTQTATGVIEAVSALSMTIAGGRDVEASGAGRTLATLLPDVAYENVRYTPVVGRPWIRETYLPGGGSKATLGAFGDLDIRPLYVLAVHVPQLQDTTAADRYADALVAHFAPGTPLTVGSDTLRVRTDVLPSPGGLVATADGWAVLTVTIPLWLRTPNSR
jgi:hypothetical protein